MVYSYVFNGDLMIWSCSSVCSFINHGQVTLRCYKVKQIFNLSPTQFVLYFDKF